MNEEVNQLLGEPLLCCPGTGSRLLRWSEMHRLMELTGGAVYLRKRDWRITLHRMNRLFVRVSLRID